MRGENPEGQGTGPAAASRGAGDERGGGSGVAGLREAYRAAETASAGVHPLIGLPRDPQEVEVGGA